METNRKLCSTKGCKQRKLKEGLCFRCYKAKHGVPRASMMAATRQPSGEVSA